MKRTPEQEQMIDELAEKAGIDRDAVAGIVDKIVQHATKLMIEKVLDKIKDGAEAYVFASGGPVTLPAPRILTNEYVVPKRSLARMNARNIRSRSRLD